jgi:hypothetical protein
MLIVKAGGGIRRLAQMEHTRDLVAPTGILRDLSEDEMRRLLHEETIVVEFEPREAKRSLPRLARSTADRRKLHAMFDAIERDKHLDERQRALITHLRHLLPIARSGVDGAGRPGPARTSRPRRAQRGTQPEIGA